jgi:hypothetical protein
MIPTERAQLRPIRDRLSRPLPRLYENLVLNYRWPEVYLHGIRLKANSPGPDLSGLAGALFEDPAFESVLIREGYLPFAYGGGDRGEWSFDPVCFDLNRLRSNCDCPIMRFEHESILCWGKIGEVWQLWPSMEAMMVDTIKAAKERQAQRRPH